MKLKEFIITVKQACRFIEQEGYTLREVNTSLNRNFWYEKHERSQGYRITFNWTQYGDEFHVIGLHCLKRFNVVEQELQKILGGELIDYYTIHKSPLTDYIPVGLEFQVLRDNAHFVLREQNDILLFANFVKEFFFTETAEFFHLFEKLETVYKTYLSLGREKISTLISGIGNTIFYRELVLKYIFNAEDKNTYYQMVVGELEQVKNNLTFGEILENLKQIKTNLSQTV